MTDFYKRQFSVTTYISRNCIISRCLVFLLCCVFLRIASITIFGTDYRKQDWPISWQQTGSQMDYFLQVFVRSDLLMGLLWNHQLITDHWIPSDNDQLLISQSNRFSFLKGYQAPFYSHFQVFICHPWVRCSTKGKGWTFLISGTFTNRTETQIIGRK